MERSQSCQSRIMGEVETAARAWSRPALFYHMSALYSSPDPLCSRERPSRLCVLWADSPPGVCPPEAGNRGRGSSENDYLKQ